MCIYNNAQLQDLASNTLVHEPSLASRYWIDRYAGHGLGRIRSYSAPQNVCRKGCYWGFGMVSTAHDVCRAILTHESLLWLMPMASLTLAVVDKREHMSIDEQIPLPRYATASRPTPITPTQRAEPWDDMVSPPPQRVFQPLLPEN